MVQNGTDADMTVELAAAAAGLEEAADDMLVGIGGGIAEEGFDVFGDVLSSGHAVFDCLLHNGGRHADRGLLEVAHRRVD